MPGFAAPLKTMKTLDHALRCAALLAAVSLAPAALLAQMDSTTTSSPAAASPSNDSGLAHSDRTFFKKAATGGMKEVAVSQAVMDHLTNPQVRNFAQMMITDHTAANAELAVLAANKGVTLPGPDEAITEKWSKKDNGADKAYIDEMVTDHEGVVKLFEKTTKSGDADIAAFAVKMLPTLQHHLEMAQDLQKSM
jgi:putative membrane protein